MRNAGLDEAQAGTKTEVSVTCYADDTTLMEEAKELKSLLKEEWKSWLKTQFRKLRR